MNRVQTESKLPYTLNLTFLQMYHWAQYTCKNVARPQNIDFLVHRRGENLDFDSPNLSNLSPIFPLVMGEMKLQESTSFEI